MWRTRSRSRQVWRAMWNWWERALMSGIRHLPVLAGNLTRGSRTTTT
jgi:hypothetical protein